MQGNDTEKLMIATRGVDSGRGVSNSSGGGGGSNNNNNNNNSSSSSCVVS
jgi:hypothetical protein